MKRQYAEFAGIANGGEKCNAFFDKLVRRGFAVAAACIHNRARLYHVHHRPLYHAIGEPDSRYRRAVPARLAAERLMRLDAALTGPNLDWLTTRSEKVTYLCARTAAETYDHSLNATTLEPPDLANQFPGTVPIGIDPSGHVVLLYLATVPWTDDFRTFLVGHTALLRVSAAWTLRLVFPQTVRRAFPAYEAVIHQELESPLQADTIYDLKRYFFQPDSLTRSPSMMLLSSCPSSTKVLRSNAVRAQEVTQRRRTTDGAAFSAAPDRGFDRRGFGTQDVNDPASGPAMRPQGCSGVVHVLGSTCLVQLNNAGRQRARFMPARGAISSVIRPDSGCSKRHQRMFKIARTTMT